MNLPNSPVHYRYWILFLLATIIFIISEKWSDKAGFTTYLSNAATLTSLLLGLAAIFYAYISNESISNNLGKVQTISQDIEDVKNQISKELIESNKNSERLSEYTETLSGLTRELNSSIIKLPRVVGELKDESLILKSKVESMDASLSELCNSVAIGQKDAAGPAFVSREDDENQSESDFAYELLERSDIFLSSLIMVFSLYQSSHRNGHLAIRELADLCRCPAPVALSYIGFLGSLGLMSFSFAEGENRSRAPIKITYLHSTLSSNSLINFRDKLSRYDPGSRPNKFSSFLEDVQSEFG